MVLILLTIHLPNSINATKNVEENLKISSVKVSVTDLHCNVKLKSRIMVKKKLNATTIYALKRVWSWTLKE